MDGSTNPDSTKLGDELEDITGVVTYAFGFYRILPTAAVKTVKTQTPSLPPVTSLVSSGKCDGLTVGVYNVENLFTNSPHLPDIASHITTYLKSPDLVFIQEVQVRFDSPCKRSYVLTLQDDNGPTNDAGKRLNWSHCTPRTPTNSRQSFLQMLLFQP